MSRSTLRYDGSRVGMRIGAGAAPHHRRWYRLPGRVALALACATAVAWGHPGAAGAAPAEVKYYVVQTQYEGEPETLWNIAARVLGSGSRYPEIYQLNADRRQPDGGQLTDPTQLTAGWLLILPWDAAGSGVRVGPLPDSVTPVTATPSRSPGMTNCAVPAPRTLDTTPWAQLRLAPDRAWLVTQGAGVIVAAIDTGVDAQAPALAGRVLPGLDVDSPDGDRGDCVGHGTATAGIVVAQPRAGTGLVGIAPRASILPVRTRVQDGTVAPTDAATAITAAVAAGARVVMLAASTDLSAAAVQVAVTDAIAHDAVVVVAASPVAPAGAPLDGLLRVAAVRPDDQLVAACPAGAVDLVAPGQNVVTVAAGGAGEVEGTGNDFAVPFVAGAVALVRAAAPDLSAAEVTRRILRTAEAHGPGARPDPAYGWGLVMPGAAVLSAPSSADSPPALAMGDGGAARWAFRSAAVASLGIAVGVFIWYRRRRAHAPTGANVGLPSGK